MVYLFGEWMRDALQGLGLIGERSERTEKDHAMSAGSDAVPALQRGSHASAASFLESGLIPVWLPLLTLSQQSMAHQVRSGCAP
jgi:hypothetical protein